MNGTISENSNEINNINFEFFVPKLPKKLAIALPSSLLEDCPTLREKTVKIGFIARAVAIYRVEEVIIFKDYRENVPDDSNLMKLLFEYMETPQYLRRKLFPLRRELQFVGVLPPLCTPHHTLVSKYDSIPSPTIREGIVVKIFNNMSFIDVGLDKLVVIRKKLPINSRVTILIDKERYHCELIQDKSKIKVYWGYNVSIHNEKLSRIKEKFNYDLIIATSRKGDLITNDEIFNKLVKEIKKSKSILILFGSPKAGLYEICDYQGIKLNEITNFVINFIPNQGTRTVRTEEAIYATLSIINFIMHKYL